MCLKRLVILAAGCALLAGQADAALFNHQRRGFVLGAGLGPGLTHGAPISDSLHWVPKSNFSIWFPQLRVGGAPSDRLAIYGMLQTAMYDLPGIGDDLGGLNRWLFGLQMPLPFFLAPLVLPFGYTFIPLVHSHSTLGAGMTYYFASDAPSPFVELGVGRTPHKAGTALGFSAGGGYEFARHWSLGLNVMYSPVLGYSGTGNPNLFSVGLTFNLDAY